MILPLRERSLVRLVSITAVVSLLLAGAFGLLFRNARVAESDVAERLGRVAWMNAVALRDQHADALVAAHVPRPRHRFHSSGDSEQS
jgi:hypothetical protein